MVPELTLILCLSAPPADLPHIAAWIRGSGRREWVRYYRCEDRRNWCDRGLEGVGRDDK